MKKVLSLIVLLGIIAVFITGCETHRTEVLHEGTVVSEKMIVD